MLDPWPWPGIPDTPRKRQEAQDPARRAQFDRLYSQPMTRQPKSPRARGICLYLGDAYPRQPGLGCRQALRRCDIHGTCSTGPTPAPAWCCNCDEFTPRE